MTQTSAFHFESLVWDWPIAIYLFLIGISAGLVTLAVLLRRVYPQAGGADSTLLRTTLIVGPGAVILGLLILVFHLTRPWTFWKLMFHYSFTSVMSMGVMLFQLYMVVLVLTLMVTSKGIAGVPGVSFVVLLATLGSVGIPLEGLAFIAGVDRILDMARTALNVVGNALAVLVIAKWEHKFDRKKALAYEREVLGKFDKTADQ